MFADVYPLLRLPRRFGAFTYEVPKEMPVKRGDHVRIPWRARDVYGIVARSSSQMPTQKKIQRLADVVPYLSPDELAFYEALAAETFSSVSTVLLASLHFSKTGYRDPVYKLPIQPCSSLPFRFHRGHINALRTIAEQAVGCSFVQTDDVTDAALLARFLQAKSERPILLLAASLHDADVMACILATSKRTALCTSAQTATIRAQHANAWRQEKINILIGTRLASLLPPPPNLGGIVIARSGVAEHAQADRNPRYDARSVALNLAMAHHAPLLLCDVAPRAWDLLHGTYTRSTLTENLDMRILSLKNVFAEDKSLVSQTFENIVCDTLAKNQRVLVVCNRRGLGARLQCATCKFTEMCGACQAPLAVYEDHLFCRACNRTTRRPPLCRACGKELRVHGRGTHTLVRELETLFPDATIALAEKTEPRPTEDANIIVATSYYYAAHYTPGVDHFGTVILPCADQFLSDGGRGLLEHAAIARRCHASTLLQTWDPDLVSNILTHPDAIAKRTLETSGTLALAPAVRCVRIRLARTMAHRGTGDVRAGTPTARNVVNTGGVQGRQDPCPEKISIESIEVDLRAADPDIRLIAAPDDSLMLLDPSPAVLSLLQKMDDTVILTDITSL